MTERITGPEPVAAPRGHRDEPPDDRADARSAATGDREAFARLYRRHVGRLRRVARWTMGHDDVGDAVQDAFFRAWEKLALYRGDAAFVTWLDRVAVNVFLRARERDGKRRSRFVAADPLPAAASAPETPGIRVDIERAVATLPERARLVFVLHDVQGLDHREVAERLGITTHTSRSQLHRARMILREYLDDEE